jgi:hypothetical protein
MFLFPGNTCLQGKRTPENLRNLVLHRGLFLFEKITPRGVMKTRYRTLALRKGHYPVVVKYFQEGGTNMMVVSWKGPGIDKQEIPASALFH